MLKQSVKIPSADILRRELKIRAAEAREEIKEELAKVRRVSIALDVWTSPNHLAFLAVQAYYITDDWKYRHALIGFARMRDAIMARNCLHGFVVSEAMGGGRGGTVLRLSYRKRVKAHSVWKWLANHSRIVIPVIAALLAGLSVVIFDPMRKALV